MSRNCILVACGLVLLLVGSVSADEPGTSQMYGSGVHAFYSGEYLAAYDHLTTAIDAGSLDPRCYYYRGLTFLRLGREPEAEMDFATGAEMETRDSGGFYDVATALERVQGSARLSIEQHRVDARAAARQRAEAQRKARYESIRDAESRVLATTVQPATRGAIEVLGQDPPPPDEATAESGNPSQPDSDPFGADPFGYQPDESQPGELEITTQPNSDPFGGEPDDSSSSDSFGAQPGELQIVPATGDSTSVQSISGSPVVGALGEAIIRALGETDADSDTAVEFPDETTQPPISLPPVMAPDDDPSEDEDVEPAATPIDDPLADDDPFSTPAALPPAETPGSSEPSPEPPGAAAPVGDPVAGGPTPDEPDVAPPIPFPPGADPLSSEPSAEPPAEPSPEPPVRQPVDDPFA